MGLALVVGPAKAGKIARLLDGYLGELERSAGFRFVERAVGRAPRGGMRLTPEARARIHVNYHEAGHMMYIHQDSARKFRDDVVGFIKETDRLN